MSQNKELSHFFPKGAIAFFIAILALMAVIWLAAYGLMIYRHGG